MLTAVPVVNKRRRPTKRYDLTKVMVTEGLVPAKGEIAAVSTAAQVDVHASIEMHNTGMHLQHSPPALSATSAV